MLPIGDGLTLVIDERDGSVYCLAKAAAGGHTKVDTGICFGIGTRARKSCCNISAKFIRFAGSTIKHFLMKSLEYAQVWMCSGN